MWSTFRRDAISSPLQSSTGRRLSIAISSEGEAPVLARLVRARIEAMFSPKLGKLAALAGLLRDKVSETFTSGDDRAAVL